MTFSLCFGLHFDSFWGTTMGFIFSQKSIFHLNKLSNTVYKTTAMRFRLNDINGVRDLLRCASRVNDQQVAVCKANFVNSLEASERDNLLGGVPVGNRQSYSASWYAQVG